MNHINALPDLQTELVKAKTGFQLERVGLSEMADWSLRDGALSHRSGGFFSVVGVQLLATGERRVMLYQPQSALTGLLTTTHQGQRYFLLQARAEPGNCGITQFGPTVQSTPANYLRLHGGQTSPYIDWFTRFQADIAVLHDSMQLDLGERYLFKCKRLLVVQCPADIPVIAGFTWVSAPLLAQAVTESTFLNTDLRSLINVCPWLDDDALALQPHNEQVVTSLRQEVRPQAMALALGPGVRKPITCKFVPLSKLDDWQTSDQGLIAPTTGQGFDVEYVHVSAQGREVRHWHQPLLNSRSTGWVALACRVQQGVLECAVRLAAETGLQTGVALLPTRLQYPGTPTPAPPLHGHRLAVTIESDEGGRFYQDASRYELVLTDANTLTQETDLIWLNIAELRALLRCSNLCSIQLRGVFSLLLGRTKQPGTDHGF